MEWLRKFCGLNILVNQWRTRFFCSGILLNTSRFSRDKQNIYSTNQKIHGTLNVVLTIFHRLYCFSSISQIISKINTIKPANQQYTTNMGNSKFLMLFSTSFLKISRFRFTTVFSVDENYLSKFLKLYSPALCIQSIFSFNRLKNRNFSLTRYE